MRTPAIRACARILLLLLLFVTVSASLSACADREKDKDALPRVTLTDASALSMRVQLEKEQYKTYKKQTVSVYALYPEESLSAITEKAPIATAKLTSQAPEITFSASSAGALAELLYATYVLLAPDGTLLTPTPIGVSDASAGATARALSPSSQRIKGLTATDAELTRSLYAAHTVVEVSAAVLTQGDADASASLFGRTLALNSAVLASVDARVGEATRAGLCITLALLPDAALSLSEYAILFDLLAARYNGGENGLVSAFMLGKAEDRTLQNSTTAESERDAALLRLANLALSARVAGSRVYLAVGGEKAAVEAHLVAVDRLTDAAGFSFGVAFSPDCTVASRVDGESVRMLLSDLPELAQALARRLGSGVHFALVDLRFSAEDQDLQAALVTYAYRVATGVKADMMIYSAPVDEAMGLYTSAFAKRKAADAYRLADTRENTEGERLAAALLEQDWKRLGSSVRPARVLVTEVANLGRTEEIGKRWFGFSGEDFPAFAVAGRGSSPEVVTSVSLGSKVLASSLRITENGLGSGFRTTFADSEQIKGAYMLSASLLAQTPEMLSAPYANITLLLDGTDSDGGALSYSSSIKLSCNGEWQTVSFRVQDFTSRLSEASACTLTLLMQPCDENGTPVAADPEQTEQHYALWLHSFYIRHARTDLSTPAVIGMAVLGFSVGALAVILAAKVRRRRKGSPKAH